MHIEILQTASPQIEGAGHFTKARPCILSIDGNTFTSATPKNSGEAESINRDAENFRAIANDAPRPRRLEPAAGFHIGTAPAGVYSIGGGPHSLRA